MAAMTLAAPTIPDQLFACYDFSPEGCSLRSCILSQLEKCIWLQRNLFLRVIQANGSQLLLTTHSTVDCSDVPFFSKVTYFGECVNLTNIFDDYISQEKKQNFFTLSIENKNCHCSAPCNPTQCVTGLTCRDDPNNCGQLNDWATCGNSSDLTKFKERQYCMQMTSNVLFPEMCPLKLSSSLSFTHLLFFISGVLPCICKRKFVSIILTSSILFIPNWCVSQPNIC